MDWIIFGDDWGAHPSTTQHLVKALPASDGVVWVDSIGMRTPQPNANDAARAWRKLREAITPRPVESVRDDTDPTDFRLRFEHVSPRVLPMHDVAVARRVNAVSIAAQIRRACGRIGARHPVVLAANPVAVRYLDDLDVSAVVYLRLDDYARLPGVDSRLAEAAEREMFARADIVAATAPALLPSEGETDARVLYLPQGVNTRHFGKVPSRVPAAPTTVGFFGLLAEWVDAELIAETARRMPDVTFELLGPRRVEPPALKALENVVLRDAVAYAKLPDAIAHWHGAWIPFEVSELTRAVNPLKLREYLAAGLPTASTPMPAVQELNAPLRLIATADDAEAWIREEVLPDTVEARDERKRAMRPESWMARASALREALASLHLDDSLAA